MPWARPEAPSIQIASLKAHLDRALQRRDDCRAYSAFFSILHDCRGRGFQRFFRTCEFYGEQVYKHLYVRRFDPAQSRGGIELRRLLETIRSPLAQPPSLRALNGLERATRSFLDRRVAPNLIARGLNLVGFTLNFHQVYSSLYAAEHLRRTFPDRHFLFVYGGSSVSFPAVYKLLVERGVGGVIVVGEGEKKLELLVRTFEKLPFSRAGNVPGAAAGLDPGLVVIGDKVDFSSRNPAHYATQITSLNELALPDYDEYFSALRRACADEQSYAAYCASTNVLVEGSRGCFGRCDFCAMNRSWHGFRKRSADRIVRDTIALTRKYRTSRVMFVDNVCDAWAADYARMLLQTGVRQRSFMELRADHPEQFWTSLALAGVETVQIGVEALSSALLKAMGKGIRAVQNLAAHKCLVELGIRQQNQLITHHPASTLADVRETRRVLELVPHLAPFVPTEFQLMVGSPLYEGLSQQERATPKLNLIYSSAVPRSLRPGREVRRAWSSFERHYERERARQQAQRPRLDVVKVAPDTLRITDTRGGTMLCAEFSGAAARIYDVCHGGLKLSGIVRATGLSPETVKAGLARFLRSKFVLRVDDDYLSLATRPRDELLRRFFLTHRQCQATPACSEEDRRGQPEGMSTGSQDDNA
jgi:radical SAM superfamily enzyme YgiQ (UPF0313 family)